MFKVSVNCVYLGWRHRDCRRMQTTLQDRQIQHPEDHQVPSLQEIFLQVLNIREYMNAATALSYMIFLTLSEIVRQ